MEGRVEGEGYSCARVLYSVVTSLRDGEMRVNAEERRVWKRVPYVGATEVAMEGTGMSVLKMAMWRVWAMARRGGLSICGLLCCLVFSPFSVLGRSRVGGFSKFV